MKNYSHRTVVGKMIAAAFGNLAVKDAMEPLLLIPIEDDFKNAVRKDPKNCGLSRCVERMYGATLAMFFKRCAYVDMVGSDGIRCVKRYTTTTSVLEQLSAFDRAQNVKTGRSIKLLPPSPGQTMAGMRKRNSQWRRSDVGKAVAAETKARSSLRIAERGLERAETHYKEAKSEHGSSSPVLKIAVKQKVAATTELQKAREKAAAAVERSKKLRSVSFRNGVPPKPRKFDLSVRNASGFFSGATA
jgi:hypothetical protein